jgi:hypothetical protein
MRPLRLLGRSPTAGLPALLQGSQAIMLIVYTLAIGVSATLLFLVQPMFARMILPMLGGTPSVWNTAMVFYQTMLLLGYIYAHLATRWLGVRRQAILHIVLLLVPLVVLPIAVPAGWTPPATTNPIPWLLLLLLAAVGLPFFAISATSPLLQKWFAASRHRSAADPYFLYAASNLGSMLALVSYPLIVEPRLRLAEQSRLWAVGYGLLVMLIAGCAVLMLRSAQGPDAPVSHERAVTQSSHRPLPMGRRLRWIALSLVPSGLMLNVTTFLSTDIAAIPLLWVVPLALYLLTFILVFSRRTFLPHWLMIRAMPIVLLPLLITIMARATQPIALLIPLHLLVFFVVAMVCHGELAKDRPSTEHLTQFYLWMSFGGMLGGIFNALLAPLLFTTILEYPLTLVLACLIMPRDRAGRSDRRRRVLDILLPLGLFILTVGLVAAVQNGRTNPGNLGIGLMFGIPALLCFPFSRRPLRFGLGIAGVLAASMLYLGGQGQILYSERSFFGLNRVALGSDDQYHLLIHGGTIHGMQSRDETRRREPLAYYYPSGPLGQLFADRQTDSSWASEPIAVIGLGTGSVACYALPGQPITFYEIDPVVEAIARDPRYFSFLRDCAPDAEVVLGDARLTLAGSQDRHYKLLVLDAYSSDAIPVHLITRQALELYLAKLAPGGVLAFHISNLHLDLEPVLGNLARDAGLAALYQNDVQLDAEDRARGKAPSQWLLMARDEADFGALAGDKRWKPARVEPGAPVWTDDFSSILSAFK